MSIDSGETQKLSQKTEPTCRSHGASGTLIKTQSHGYIKAQLSLSRACVTKAFEKFSLFINKLVNLAI